MKKEIIIPLLCYLISFPLFSVSIEYSMFTHKNQRPYQEDTFSYYTVKNEYFLGIYDGHGGDKTSSYLKDNLYYSFFENHEKTKTIQQKFEFAFSKADKYAQNTFDDGSTAVTVFIDTNNRAHFAWVGDSRAMIENNGNVQFATLDHKPNRPDEQKRIEKAGGNVYHHVG